MSSQGGSQGGSQGVSLNQGSVHKPKTCPHCDLRVGSSGYVTCRVCQKKVHALCTDLTTSDFNDKAILQAFSCKCCRPSPADIELDKLNMVNLDILTDIQVVKHLVLEVRCLRSLMSTYREENTLLRTEIVSCNTEVVACRAEVVSCRAEIRDLKKALSTPASSTIGDRSRSRTPSRIPQKSPASSLATVKFQSSFERKPAQNFSAQPTPNRESSSRRVSSSVRPGGMPMRGEKRVLRVGKKEAGHRALPTAPPVPIARIRTRRVFVSGIEAGVSAEKLYDHLKICKVFPLRVSKIRTKYDSYSSFIVDLSEIDYDKLFDEDLWQSETVIKDFVGKRDIPVLEMFPSA